MFSTIRSYVDASLAIATMTGLGIVSGLIAAAITGDRTLVVTTMICVFLGTGVGLTLRLWQTTRKSEPFEPDV